MDQIREGLARSGPIDAGLYRSSGCDSYGAHATTTSERWEPCHRANERLANRDYIGLLKEAAEALPVLFVAQGIDVRSHGLIDVHSQGSVKPFGYSRHIRQTQVIRLHHDRYDGYGHAQSYTSLCLLMDELPITRSALPVLFRLGGIVERELDVVEGAQFIVFENGDAVAVRSDGELDRSGL